MFKTPNPFIKVLDYPVPSYANSILYMFGGISAVAFLILIATGVFLTQVYNPVPDGAHASIINAVTTVPLADFARSLHFWTASLVVILLLLHVIRVFVTGSYKKPRRLIWLTGVALLALTVVYIFIGTVLKWDQEGVEAFVHMKESFELFGINLGLTNGGVPVITQLYSWHTTILLLALIGLLVIHMALIKLRGISPKPIRGAVAAPTAGRGYSSFLSHLKRLAGFGLLFLAVASLLAVVFPAPLGYPGDLDQEVTKPLWMFWPFFALENIFGLKGLLFGLAGFFLFLAAVPFIDRTPYLHWSKRKFILGLGSVVLITLVGLAAYSRIYPPTEHIAVPGGSMSKTATAGSMNIPRKQLRGEAPYLLVAVAITGAAGLGLTYRVRTRP